MSVYSWARLYRRHLHATQQVAAEITSMNPEHLNNLFTHVDTSMLGHRHTDLRGAVYSLSLWPSRSFEGHTVDHLVYPYPIPYDGILVELLYRVFSSCERDSRARYSQV